MSAAEISASQKPLIPARLTLENSFFLLKRKTIREKRPWLMIYVGCIHPVTESIAADAMEERTHGKIPPSTTATKVPVVSRRNGRLRLLDKRAPPTFSRVEIIIIIIFFKSPSFNYQKSLSSAGRRSMNAFMPSFLSAVSLTTPKRFASISTAFLISIS